MVVDLVAEEIKEMQHVEGYEYMHQVHTFQALIEMAKIGDTRKEKLVMWYWDENMENYGYSSWDLYSVSYSAMYYLRGQEYLNENSLIKKPLI